VTLPTTRQQLKTHAPVKAEGQKQGERIGFRSWKALLRDNILASQQ
jgi:hypothetical protein